MATSNQRRTCSKSLLNILANKISEKNTINMKENTSIPSVLVEMGHHALALEAPLSMGWRLGLWGNGEEGG